MSEAVIATIITGCLSILGIILSAVLQSRKVSKDFEKNSELADERLRAQLEKHQAVTDTKIDELARETREHNQFARRMPVVEEQIKVINHRLTDLEEEVKKK